MIRVSFRWGVAITALSLASWAFAADRKSDWIEGEGNDDGATRDYYNRAARLAWVNFMGDWRDAKNVRQGEAAYAVANMVDDDSGRFIEWDVTKLVREWRMGTHPNQGFFLRTPERGGKIDFAAQEHSEATQRPQLLIEAANGAMTLAPTADTHVVRSTYQSHGSVEFLRVSPESHALLRFDPESLARLGNVSKATLRLFTTRQYGGAAIGVFRCSQGHKAPASDPVFGVSARHPGDRGIAADAAVIFATDFESSTWANEWTRAAEMRFIDTVSRDAERRFEPLRGKSLRVRIAKGANGALNTLFKFQREIGGEPEELYFRYYLRLGDDWNQSLQGGKMPGISGTYGIAGWGGRKSDGRNGWSARGLFVRTVPKGSNPLAGTTPIGTYCYHADMKGQYGDHFIWQDGYRGYLENNRWYCVEHYVKLNTPGKKDGVLRGWIDGRPAFEKMDLRYRLTDKLRIEQVWMNVYHGGKLPSPYDQHVFVDNVVIAREYIGPMKLDD